MAINVNADKIRQVLKDAIEKYNLTDDDIKTLRTMKITDDIISKMISLMPDDVLAKIHLNDSDGAW